MLTLISRGIRTPEVIETLLERACDIPVGWNLLAALVVARCDPDQAERLFRQGLRCPNSEERIQVLAMLAISDWPWADGLLQKVLTKFKSPFIQSVCRLALEWRNGNESPAERL